MVPEVVGAHVLDADNGTGGGPRVRQILAAEGEPVGRVKTKESAGAPT